MKSPMVSTHMKLVQKNFNNVLVTGRLDQTLRGVASGAIDTFNIDNILKDDFNAAIAECEFSHKND